MDIETLSCCFLRMFIGLLTAKY